jgi:hypothetical protein
MLGPISGDRVIFQLLAGSGKDIPLGETGAAIIAGMLAY